MNYKELIKHHIENNGMSCQEIVDKMKMRGVKLDRSYISMLKNGRKSPASDKVNIALAEVLGIDSAELRIAAVKEKISPDLYQLIKKIG
ncbi:helix-turn-helix domain-containing protein [Paenibacillus alvei]|uniref:Helix-turn-helix domain-containing protein n=1 Tax=Paenibacillus alvei TaxID=44250 RepID=A0ABT4H5W1_PAEAL|nr:helix-turn-helix domain-containing protein [Paenibacillus alvei]MCY9764279.1 helix-turn-helix domain-containing protein [Paenibacillus alvei]MCY9770452.1 helix-turn-helix domain-containing protein [Paenibacillus alvei]